MDIWINVKKLVDYEEVYSDEEGDYNLEDFELYGEAVKLKEPVHANFNLTRVRSGILMDGKMETTVELTCVRCLKRFDKRISVEVHEAFSMPGFEENFQGFDDVYTIERESEINIEPALHSNLVVSIPSNPICDEACKGICPHCGADLNLEECSCEKKVIDPRLEVLKKFKDSL